MQMALTDLVPWGWGRQRPSLAPRLFGDSDPFLSLHREMNRMFDDFARDFGVPSRFGATTSWPSVEVRETDSEVNIEAELPGLDEKDVEVSVANGVLTIKGEKKGETNGSLYSERWHGKFQRSLELNWDVDSDKAKAAFKNGVLTVTLPKLVEAQKQVKRIPIAAN
jgi:HSP20 family protein